MIRFALAASRLRLIATMGVAAWFASTTATAGRAHACSCAPRAVPTLAPPMVTTFPRNAMLWSPTFGGPTVLSDATTGAPIEAHVLQVGDIIGVVGRLSVGRPLQPLAPYTSFRWGAPGPDGSLFTTSDIIDDQPPTAPVEIERVSRSMNLDDSSCGPGDERTVNLKFQAEGLIMAFAGDTPPTDIGFARITADRRWT